MATEIKILRKEGWELNPDDNKVNNIIQALGKNEGHCPTKRINRNGHDQCPCSQYLTHDECYCGLYVKLPKINKDESKRTSTTDVPYSC